MGLRSAGEEYLCPVCRLYWDEGSMRDRCAELDLEIAAIVKKAKSSDVPATHERGRSRGAAVREDPVRSRRGRR